MLPTTSPWECAQPFGGPVLPEVYAISARSSASVATGSKCSGPASTSASKRRARDPTSPPTTRHASSGRVSAAGPGAPHGRGRPPPRARRGQSPAGPRLPATVAAAACAGPARTSSVLSAARRRVGRVHRESTGRDQEVGGTLGDEASILFVGPHLETHEATVGPACEGRP